MNIKIKDIEIAKEQVLEYIKITGGRKSFLIEDYKQSKTMTADEFIYIGDNLEKLLKKFNIKINKKAHFSFWE